MLKIRVALYRWLIGLLIASTVPAVADSYGPLKYNKAYSEKPNGLIAILGNPELGIPFPVRYKAQRIANEEKWLLETSVGLSVMKADIKSGEVTTSEYIESATDWCLSKDANFLFCGRRGQDETSKRPYGGIIYECFDFRDGSPLWTLSLDKTLGASLYASMFSDDGQFLITLQSLGKRGDEAISTVIWYEVATGKKSRQVNLPGTMARTKTFRSEFLAEAAGLIFVTRPSEESVKAFIIRDGNNTAEPVELQPDKDVSSMNKDYAPQIITGGLDSEWIVFYSNYSVQFYKLKNEKLIPAGNILTPPDSFYFYQNHVRFSPDGSEVLVATQNKTLIVSTSEFPSPKATTIKQCTDLGDYTLDGKFFVFFDKGGGFIYNTEDWSSVTHLKKGNHSGHCCPITEASISPDGKFIVSSDGQCLLLWSKSGDLVAKLLSPKSDDKEKKVSMQSAVFHWDSDRIFAGDGWGFFSWELEKVIRASKRNRKGTLKIMGESIVHYDESNQTKPQLMDIALVSKEKNLITAKNKVIQYWSDGGTKASKPLLIPAHGMITRPRSLYLSGNPEGIVMKNAGHLTLIDPENKKKAVPIGHNASGVDAENGYYFKVNSRFIERIPMEPNGAKEDKMETPTDWAAYTTDQILTSKDGNRLTLLGNSIYGESAISVIDWRAKKVVSIQTFPWKTTSISTNKKGSKLILGSQQGAVYVIDIN